VTVALRLRGVDVLTAQEDGSAEFEDDALLLRSASLERVLVSQDSDMLREGARMLERGVAFTGIVYSHQLRITIGQMVEDLELIGTATSLEEWRGRIEFLPIG
jgi:predicted nuclease of predicted toxin-antitoxin system